MTLGTVLPERYSLENVRRVARDPQLIRKELFYLAITMNGRFRCTVSSLVGRGDGVDVMSEAWDTLVILDACRHDLFEARSPLDGELRSVRSGGSDSWEFMERNFAGRTLHDTVYVTANPHVYQLDDGVFHAVVDLLETDWDEEVGTVHPEDVVEAAVDAHERYPDKRLIVHFMQPHFPFLGPTGTSFGHSGIELHVEESERSGATNPWFGIVYGDLEVDGETVRRAYRENFDLTIPHVERLLTSIPGKSVVTADHGNLVGERGFPVPLSMYGHPRGLDHDALRTVPWLEYPYSERRETVASRPVDEATDDPENDVVEERLRALGYV